MHVPAGTILTFYLQTRLNSADGNDLDLLPKGTRLVVRILDTVDSNVNQDGSGFRGLIVSPVVSADGIVVHANAEVQGLFALQKKQEPSERISI
jgi:hypothetical protein